MDWYSDIALSARCHKFMLIHKLVHSVRADFTANFMAESSTDGVRSIIITKARPHGSPRGARRS